MAVLENLRKNLLDMTQQQMLDKIREIRTERRISRSPKKEKKVKKEAKQGADKVKKLLGKLSPAEQAALLAQLQEG